jgi:hypothetical protein
MCLQNAGGDTYFGPLDASCWRECYKHIYGEYPRRKMLQLNPNFEIKESKITLQFNQEEAKFFTNCTSEQQAYFNQRVHEAFEKEKFFSSSANKKK